MTTRGSPGSRTGPSWRPARHAGELAAFFQLMADSVIQVLEFNPINPLAARKVWELNQRDHRKLLIVVRRRALRARQLSRSRKMLQRQATSASVAVALRRSSPCCTVPRSPFCCLAGRRARSQFRATPAFVRELGERLAARRSMDTNCSATRGAHVKSIALRGARDSAEIQTRELEPVNAGGRRAFTLTHRRILPRSRWPSEHPFDGHEGVLMNNTSAERPTHTAGVVFHAFR